MWPIYGPAQANDLQQISTREARSLRASTALTSLWHAIEICAINSIEAGCFEVHVEVDASSFAFKIVDNGHGIADLRLLGTWNGTSKSSKSAQHVGIGLASICSTAVVEIISRAAGSFETHSCLLRAGELVQFKLAAEQKPRSGTSFLVRDMFFNRPITRKSLANGRSNKEVEKCRDVLTGLALLRPDITFTLYDKGTRSFILKHLKGRSQLQMVSGFFGNPYNSLNNVAQFDNLSNFAGKSGNNNNNGGGWRVAGWAVRPPSGHPTPSRQRIFINSRAVKAPILGSTIDEIFNELYRAVLKQQVREKGDLLSIRKANNQHAMFVLSLSCPPELVEILPEPGGGTVLVEDWVLVQEAVRQAVLIAWNPVLNTALLKEKEADDKMRNGSSSVPAMPVPQNGLHYIRDCTNMRKSVSERAPSRAGSGNDIGSSFREMLPTGRLPPQRSASTSSGMMIPSSSSSKTTGTDSTLPSLVLRPLVLLNCDPSKQPQQQPSLIASWRQRRELSRSRIASGVGAASAAVNMPPPKRARSSTSIGLHSLRSSVPNAGIGGGGGGAQTGGEVQGDSITRAAPAASYSILDAILSSWKNPAMMPDTATGKSQDILTLEGLSSAVFARLRPEVLERENLQGARALRQVDSKFVPIMCSNGVFALLDQHAADERVQLEKLRAQIVAPTGGPVDGACLSMQLPTPQPLRLGADEIPLLEAFGKVVWQWGWRWITYPGSAAAPEVLVEVTAVPLIAQRALTATDMRIYLHDLASTHGGAGPPSGVVRVLNSKACRTAIMFGDELLPAQCQDLVDELQHTQLCFICAHGRPTTVPVVDLVAVSKATAVIQAAKKTSGGSKLAGLKDKLIAILNE
ncbi:hypothetical protein Ndes2526B_g01218 [Nannochloris sp. 'desiccata']|nr:putative DNA mismatch repair protein MLH3 [Chlorella desiccata (nom. nud.)]